jgi:hypothetical protein
MPVRKVMKISIFLIKSKSKRVRFRHRSQISRIRLDKRRVYSILTLTAFQVKKTTFGLARLTRMEASHLLTKQLSKSYGALVNRS